MRNNKGVSSILRLIPLMAVIPMVLLQISCGSGKATKSTTSDSTTDPGGAPPNVVNDIGFYIKNISKEYVSYMTYGTFNTACNIPTSTTSSMDISCRLDAMEGDLRFQGLQLNYNVPTTMCHYMKITPYFYYNYETGFGPSAVSYTQTVNNITGTSSVSNCSVTVDAGTSATGCTGQAEVEFDSTGASATCVYDQTASGGANCCLGNYTLSKTIVTISADPTTGNPTSSTASATTSTNWGGSYQNCMGGQGKNAWSAFTKDYWPVPVMHYTKDTGANDTLVIPGQVNGIIGSTLPVANHYTPAYHSHGGFKSGRAVSTLPYVIDPIDDRDGSTMRMTSPFYQIECLDEGHEVIHRIRLQVREWNTLTEFLAFAGSSGTRGNPDVNGYEGVNCDYSSNFGGPCNDAMDLDDLTSNGSSPYDLRSTTNRHDFFPNESW